MEKNKELEKEIARFKALPLEARKKRMAEQVISWRPNLNVQVFPDDPLDDTGKTIPEKPETINAQITLVKEGRKKAVLIPKGTVIPENTGLYRIKTDIGTFLYPKGGSRKEILEAVENDTVGDVLGYGVASKPKDANFVAVVVRNAKGIEKQAVLTGPENLESVIKASKKIMDKGDTLHLENNGQILRDRQA